MVGSPRRFTQATTDGQVRPAMTRDEIRQALGKPSATASRTTAVDVREVWIYREAHPPWKSADPRDRVFYALMGVFTLGLWWVLAPATYEEHWVVFSDGRVIGWDLPDPYAPNLIIEKRER
jgi:hypothetical protein